MRDCIRRRLAKQYKVETLGDGQASGARPGFGEQKDVDAQKSLSMQLVGLNETPQRKWLDESACS
jgi:hypothetical protein